MRKNMPVLDDKIQKFFRAGISGGGENTYIYKCTLPSLPAVKILATPMQRSLAEVVSVESVRFA